MSKMITREYQVTFLTPAFLGNAEQSGQWRTPPFKALLRQWWRVAVAADCQYNVNVIRQREAELFGSVEGTACKSLVRVRLDKWDGGRLNSAPNIGNIVLGKNSLPASLYSGYGAVIAGPRLKAKAAIQSGDTTVLRLAFPENHSIEKAIELMQLFGTIGGRSRNGWGSFIFSPIPKASKLPLVDWKTALNKDWAHGVGKDNTGALYWVSSPKQKWEDAMRLLAQARADMRRRVIDRLLLAFPSTQGRMQGWGNNDRVPHSLRFKVIKKDDGFIATIFHIPCRPSDVLWRKLSSTKQSQLETVFSQAHQFLDGHADFKRNSV
jgi:CRISPR-associated protein Cmr1